MIPTQTETHTLAQQAHANGTCDCSLSGTTGTCVVYDFERKLLHVAHVSANKPT